MTNAELYKNSGKLKAAHEAFRKVAEAGADRFCDATWIRRAVEDPYFYATKPADTALQQGLAVGSLVKIMTNLSGEGLFPHYAVVTETPIYDSASEHVKCNHVGLKFANGLTYRFKVEGLIGGPTADESQMKHGDIKACDIPAELLGLVLDKCPLKNEGACMKGA